MNTEEKKKLLAQLRKLAKDTSYSWKYNKSALVETIACLKEHIETIEKGG
jgi:hypothetical protein